MSVALVRCLMLGYKKMKKIIMKNNKLNISKRLIAVFLAVIFLITSCNDDGPESPGVAPTIPPSSSFEMDFNQFPEDGGSAGGRTATAANWSHAAVNVGVWNLIIGVATVVPVAAFKAAIDKTPEFIGSNTWQWSYNFEVDNIQHSAKLHGTLVSDGVNWKMLLSKAGAYTDYEWYSGHSNSERTEGWWILNFGPVEARPFVRIDWNRNVDNTVASIKYTSTDPQNAGIGGYIYYGINEQTPFNTYYDIFDNQDDNLVEIKWNRSNHAGTVRNPKFFGDTNFRCWNTALQDVACE